MLPPVQTWEAVMDSALLFPFMLLALLIVSLALLAFACIDSLRS
jgi:hypothetical protein